MKILHLIPYNPANPGFGGALRIYHVLKYLTNTYDQVYVAGFTKPGEEKDLLADFPSLKGRTCLMDFDQEKKEGNILKLRSVIQRISYWNLVSQCPGFQEKLDKFYALHHFDIVISEFPIIEMYVKDYEIKKIVNCHNVEYDNFRRMAIIKDPLKRWFYTQQSQLIFKEEVEILKRQDALLVTSNRDIEELEKSVAGVPKYLVPNGVNTDFFRAGETVAKPHSMVFVGMMQYLPNVDGIGFFLDEIFPIILEKYPETRLTIVGKTPPHSIAKHASENVIITGFVDDTRPYIDAASVYIVPLRMGGGTRLKVLEAMSMDKPVVSTSIGCEGIDVVNGENILIEDNPAAFAEAVLRLFDDAELYQKIKQKANKLVIGRYDWKQACLSISTAIAQLYPNDTDSPTVKEKSALY